MQDRKLRILWVLHLYPTRHNCGAEWMAHHINKFLISQGHEVRVILMQSKLHNIQTPYYIDGVRVQGTPGNHLDAYRWGDIILTHLDFTRHAINIGRIIKRPVTCFIHSHHTYDPNPIESAKSGLSVVYNSEWVKDQLNYRWPSMVLTPPCDVDYYNVCDNPIDNEYITLINVDENKGGKILRKLAKAMPDRKFLAVTGSYSETDEGQIKDQPENVKVIPTTPDILSVYRQTRILLMPSRYESWGRTATEAMCNGIPVICTPTPGLKENCKDAAIYIPERGSREIDMQTGLTVYDDEESYDIGPLIKAIKKLDKPNFYQAVSEKSRQRAKELDPKKQLHELEQFLINVKQDYKPEESQFRRIN